MIITALFAVDTSDLDKREKIGFGISRKNLQGTVEFGDFASLAIVELVEASGRGGVALPRYSNLFIKKRRGGVLNSGCRS